MAAKETDRLGIPYAAQDSTIDWYTTFETGYQQIDTRIFANLENLKPIFQELPTVQNAVGPPRELVQTGDLVMISRTFQTTVTIPAASTALSAESMLCIRITSGAVAAQTSAWEVVQNGADIDADLQVFGYVDASYNIFWWNGSTMAPSDAGRLFNFIGSGGGGDTVKVTGVDTLAGYLATKLVQGSNVTLTTLPPGASGETLRISAAGPGEVKTGAGNPNGVESGSRGQVYVDTTVPGSEIFYINTSGGTVWFVI